ncbi:MAG: valine--tRNA ligase [Candidatus Omnitrophota bacterium]|jgi:valyl-tRNA synthetase|nr:MAG: valine--tRNA ligase [Candidatus Omnitrophota bacterium]
MAIELSKQYNPHEVEDKWYFDWEKNGYFKTSPSKNRIPFCIVIPPPNVTGILHMGHALNNTIQDILIRYHRMNGEAALWMPGTDHAGIATQNVVEKSLARENIKRQDLGREKFIEKVLLWKDKYGSTIIHQLKKLGASCDWSRERFTMDEAYSRAVKHVFVRLWDKGLIYQGDKIINWCPRCQTALSDEEAPHHELDGHLYYLKYPLKADPDTFIIVATTRPETMLGDTAVAVNPRDKRYKKFLNKILLLPLVGREIKVIGDSSVDMKFGTGAVKVTPAHDPNDYIMGNRHKLKFVNVMYPDGRMNENAGEYKGMDRFEAREVIIEDLREKGLLDKIEPHALSAGHCYRCHTIIEPYLSRQWFVKMSPLAKPAIEAVKKGKIKFHPKRWTKVYLNWMENIQDWCISRQIWWGHRLPVYYCKECIKNAGEFTVHSSQFTGKNKAGIIVSETKLDKCPKCGSSDIHQEEDVLDTWFSSWLWPFATFYWPDFQKQSAISHQPSAFSSQLDSLQSTVHSPPSTDKDISARLKADLDYFYPTSTLVTAPEIIFFWVARMIMAGMEFMHNVPFKDVYIHGTVRDIEGKKMSKSLGNIIDPLEIISQYGADALRFSLISITSQGQDVYLSKDRFEQGRNFANKLWNASRFILMNMEEADSGKVNQIRQNSTNIVNKWILSRYNSTIKQVSSYLNAYKFNEAANAIYGFFWHEFCDWYLEIIKPNIKDDESRVITRIILEGTLKMLHPFMPFISEEIWRMIPGNTSTIMFSSWPVHSEKAIDKKIEARVNMVFDVISSIRNMRSELEIAVTDKINVKLFTGSKPNLETLNFMSGDIKLMSKLDNLEISKDYKPQINQYASVLKDIHIIIPLSGVIDVEKYLLKLGKRIQEVSSQIEAKGRTLENKDFIARAPAEVIKKEQDKLEELKETLNKLKVVKDGIK